MVKTWTAGEGKNLVKMRSHKQKQSK